MNILEATIKDFLKKRIWNAISGIALMISIPLITISWQGIYYIVKPNIVILWFIAYTIWNWNIVFGSFSKSVSFYHVSVLLTPLLICLFTFNPGFWLIMRSGSLAIAVSLQIAFKDKIDKFFTNNLYKKISASINKTLLQIILMSINIVLIAIFSITYLT